MSPMNMIYEMKAKKEHFSKIRHFSGFVEKKLAH